MDTAKITVVGFAYSNQSDCLDAKQYSIYVERIEKAMSNIERNQPNKLKIAVPLHEIEQPYCPKWDGDLKRAPKLVCSIYLCNSTADWNYKFDAKDVSKVYQQFLAKVNGLDDLVGKVNWLVRLDDGDMTKRIAKKIKENTSGIAYSSGKISVEPLIKVVGHD